MRRVLELLGGVRYKPMCDKCKDNPAEELHTCPFAEEIHDDYESLCNCCHECTLNCCYEI